MAHSATAASKPAVIDARQVRTRQALFNAMLKAVATTPFEEITVRQLASAANISYATFFRHYPNKEALLEDAAAGEIRRLVTLTLPLLDKVSARASCEALCNGIRKDWALWRALLTGAAQGTVKQELQRISMEVAQTRITGWPPQELRTAIAVGVIIEVLSWWLRQENPPAAKRVAAVIHDRAIGSSTLQQ